jgi:hypothetical protein
LDSVIDQKRHMCDLVLDGEQDAHPINGSQHRSEKCELDRGTREVSSTSDQGASLVDDDDARRGPFPHRVEPLGVIAALSGAIEGAPRQRQRIQ